METRSKKSHRGVSATTSSGDILPPTPATSAQVDGVSAGSRKGQGRTPREGRQHHTGGSGGMGAVGGGDDGGGLGQGEDGRDGRDGVVNGSPSSEVRWNEPHDDDDVEDGEEGQEADVEPVRPPGINLTTAEKARLYAELAETHAENLQLEREIEELRRRRNLPTGVAANRAKSRGGVVPEDDMSGVEALGGSDTSGTKRRSTASQKPGAARRIPTGGLAGSHLERGAEVPRPEGQDAYDRSSRTVPDPGLSPKKQGATGGVAEGHRHWAMTDGEFQDWMHRTDAAKIGNRRARVEFEEGRDSMADHGHDRSDGTTWKEWEADGGPYMDAEGPVGTRRADQSRGGVKLAVNQRESR